MSSVDPKGLAIWDVVDGIEFGLVAGIGGKGATYTLKSPCSSKGVRYTITVQASGISAGAAVKCKHCFTAPVKVGFNLQFDDRNGQEPNPQAFNGGYLTVGADAHFMGFGGQKGDILLGQAISVGSNFAMGFGTLGAEASGTIGTSTVTSIKEESCSCGGGN